MGVRPEETTEDRAAGTPADVTSGAPAPAPRAEAAAAPPADAGQALAAFYDRRAPAALAYCARMCRPDGIADAVEEAFGHVFGSAASGGPIDDDALDRRLRAAVRTAAADRAPAPEDAYCDGVPRLIAARAEGGLSDPERERLAGHMRGCDDCRTAENRFVDAELAYEALSGDDAPALGRSLLAEMIQAIPAPGLRDLPGLRDRDWAPPAPETRADRPAPEGVTGVVLVHAPAAGQPETPEPAPAGAPPAPAPDPEPPARRRLRVGRPHLPHVAPGWRRRLMVVLAVAGLLLLAEGVVTLVWKEPFTGYLAAQAQDDLSNQLDKLDHQPSTLGASDRRTLAAIRDAGARSRKRMALLAARLDQAVPSGDALGRIQIDKLGVDYVFVQGTDGASLRKGPGHYDPQTQLPGEGGVTGIAGHRTTYEAPFRDVNDLKAGDRIVLRMPYGRFTYEVTGSRIVPADYGRAFAASATGERLVLSACHPLYSATERILVDARLVSSEPLGAAIEPAVPAVPADSPRDIARRRTAARLKVLGARQLGPGMTGADVRELQRLLGMPVTGTFDANTSAAVLAFQRDRGLPQVGRAGTRTKLALARRAHPPARPPTPAAVPQQQPTQPNGANPYYNGQGTQTTPYPGQSGTYTAPQAQRGGSSTTPSRSGR